MTVRRFCNGIFLGVGALLLLALAGVWIVPEWTRQYRVMATGAGGALLLASWLLWIVTTSRWRWRQRLLAVIAVAAILGGLRAMMRVEGVSGDLVPVFTWRWSTPPEFARLQPRQLPAPSLADDPLDYPRFLGRQGDAIVHGVRLERDWNAHPPRVVWRRPVGAAWSGFAIAHGRAFTQESRGENECITCYDLLSGEPIWVHAYPASFQSETTIGGEGPRATPTIAGGRVYAMGATGILTCVDEGSGELLWSRNVVEENESRVPSWGKSCSPWVVGERVIVSAGGKKGRSLVAYHVATGERLWSGGDARSGYSSPFPTTLGGAQQVITFNSDCVAGHDLETGNLLWQHPWINEHPNVAQPLVIGGSRILVSSGYGVGAALLEIQHSPTANWQVSEVWRERTLKSKFANMILRGEHVFGLDDGILVCLRLADGQRTWKGGRYGHGQMLLVEDLLLVQTESGDVALVEASADSHRELGRTAPLSNKTWNHAALRPPYLLVRNHKEAVCLELTLETEPSSKR